MDRLLSLQPALTTRISKSRPRLRQVRRDVADQVANRLLLIADGDDDGELGLAMNALRQGGASRWTILTAGGVPPRHGQIISSSYARSGP